MGLCSFWLRPCTTTVLGKRRIQKGSFADSGQPDLWTCGRPAWRIVAAGEAGGDEEEGGEEDEVGQQGGGEDVVVVPVGVLPQVGQRGLVDERGEGEPIFVLLEVGSRRWSEVVDEEGDGREEVDLQADDDD